MLARDLEAGVTQEAVAALVREGERFYVTCHRRPDADALGSALGFAAILRTLGKEAVVYSVDPPPRTMRYLSSLEEVLPTVPEGEGWDACFVMDTAAAALAPPFPTGLSGPVVVIDHHAAHDAFGELVLRENDACATAMVVVRLMRALGLEKVPPAAAPPLYAALVADTGGFRYAATTAAALRLGAELVDAGARPWPTAYHLFEGWPRERMALLERVLAGLELCLGGRLAVLRVTRSTLEEVGADDEMVEGMVNWGRTLDGVRVSLLAWEPRSDDGARLTKLSLRAAGDFDVSRIAVSLGGGGHRTAAGVTLDVTMDEAISRARTLLDQALAED